MGIRVLLVSYDGDIHIEGVRREDCIPDQGARWSLRGHYVYFFLFSDIFIYGDAMFVLILSSERSTHNL